MEIWASVLMVVVSFSALLLSGFTYFRGVQRDRKQATLDAFNILQRQVFDPLNQYRVEQIEEISRISSAAFRGEELTEEEREKQETCLSEFLLLTGYLARIEHFALGINTGIYDADVAERAGTTYWCMLYDQKLRSLIETKNQKEGGREYYIELYEMMKKIRKLKKRNDRSRRRMCLPKR